MRRLLLRHDWYACFDCCSLLTAVPEPCPSGTKNVYGHCQCNGGDFCASPSCANFTNGIVHTYYYQLPCPSCACIAPCSSPPHGLTLMRHSDHHADDQHQDDDNKHHTANQHAVAA